MPPAVAAPSTLFPSQDMNDPVELKRAARRDAKIRRDAAAAARPDAAARIAELLLATVPIPLDATVAGYWPIGSELDIRPVLIRLHDQGRRVALPVAEGRGVPLRFRRWRPGLAMISGALGIPEPPPDEPDAEPDILLVPLLAFDRAGWRLGYGGGFYDRTLAGLRAKRPVVAVGVAFAGQEMAEVPRDRYDARLDWLVTEEFAMSVGFGE